MKISQQYRTIQILVLITYLCSVGWDGPFPGAITLRFIAVLLQSMIQFKGFILRSGEYPVSAILKRCILHSRKPPQKVTLPLHGGNWSNKNNQHCLSIFTHLTKCYNKYGTVFQISFEYCFRWSSLFPSFNIIFYPPIFVRPSFYTLLIFYPYS